MLRCGIFLLFAASAVSCGQQDGGGRSSAPASQPSQQPASASPSVPAPPDWTAEYDKMAATLRLSPNEIDKLKAAFQTREGVISQWTAEKGGQLKDLEKQMAAATKARDLAAVNRLTEQAKPLRNELQELVKTH